MRDPWVYITLGYRFGWAPSEIDEMPTWLVRYLLASQP